MIKIKDLSPEFQEIYIKYKQAKKTVPDETKTTFDKANQFLLEKNKKLIGMLNAEETILINQPKLERNQSHISSHINSQLEINVRKSQGAKMKRVIQDMISKESLKVPEEYNFESNMMPTLMDQPVKMATSKLIRHIKGSSSKNNLEKQQSSKLILSLKKNSSSQLLSNQSKLIKNPSGMLDQFTLETVKEINKLNENSRKEKEAIKKNHHLFKLKIQHNEPADINTINSKKMPEKLIDTVENDLVYYSSLENVYKKGRLMTLQNSASKLVLSSLRTTGERNKLKLNFDEVSPLITFQQSEKTRTSFKQLSSSKSLKIITSKLKAQDAIDDFFSTSKKIKSDFINSLEKTNEKRKELHFKYNFFKSNY